jgi:two-component system, OmpR family, heavy metal sensor histidine kinase CusS
MSSRTEPRSIASRLVLRFTLAAALLLSCSLGAFYWMVIRHSIEEDNAVLADKVDTIRANFLHEPDLTTFAGELTESARAKPLVHWVRVLDGHGTVVAETPAMQRLLPPQVFPAPVRSTSSSLPRPKDFRTGNRLFALVSVAQSSRDREFIIQVAQDRSEDDEFRREYGALFLIVLSVAIIAAALIAVSVARRGLHPLAHMTRSLERVGPTHFAEQLPPNEWPRELRPLAVAFDDMLHRLEDSFTRLSQFSADLAHELRTPIANILGEMQVSLTRERSAAEYRANIESAVTECERLSGIVENLLFLARAEAVDRQIERKEFDARAAVDDIAEYYRAAAEDRHITITCAGSGNVFAEPILFRRAVSNIVDNALRFAPNEGKIDIEVRANDYETEIVIRDNGPGIAPEHLSRVFDRFYRVDAARSTTGAGLGLSLVKSIVDLHGGSVKIDPGESAGVAVRLTFPVRQNLLANNITKS